METSKNFIVAWKIGLPTYNDFNFILWPMMSHQKIRRGLGWDGRGRNMETSTNLIVAWKIGLRTQNDFNFILWPMMSDQKIRRGLFS